MFIVLVTWQVSFYASILSITVPHLLSLLIICTHVFKHRHHRLRHYKYPMPLWHTYPIHYRITLIYLVHIHILYIPYHLMSYPYFSFCCPSLWPVGRSKRRDANLRPTASPLTSQQISTRAPEGPISQFSYCREHREHGNTLKSTSFWRWLVTVAMCACNFWPLLSCGRRKRRSQCKWPDQITNLQTSSGDSSSANERQIPKNLERLSKWVISHTVKSNHRHQHPIYINLSFL